MAAFPSLPTPDPLSVMVAGLLAGCVLALIWLARQPDLPEGQRKRDLQQLADACPWTWMDAAWLMLIVALAQATRWLLPDSAVWDIACFQGFLIAGLAWRMHRKRRPWGRPLPPRTLVVQSLVRWLAILPVLWGVAAAWQWLLHTVGHDVALQPSIQFFLDARGTWERTAFILAAVVVAPVVEEILFRGILLPLLIQRIGPLAGVALSALFFAALHGGLGAFAALAVLSIALSLAYARTGSLWVPIGMHILFNTVNLLLLWLILQSAP